MVWAFEVSQLAPMDRSSRQLGDSIFGISFPSAGKSRRFVRVDGAAAKNSAGVYHAGCLHRDCVRALSFARPVELFRFLRADRGRDLFRF